MSNDKHQAHGPSIEPWEHMRSSLHSLNVRSVRLAIALGLSLCNPQDVDQVIQRAGRAPAGPERRAGPDRRAARSGAGPDRRVAALWAELLGLLVLRYGIQRRCLEDFGIDVMRRLLADVRADMQREGFAPGSDGMDLDRKFEAA